MREINAIIIEDDKDHYDVLCFYLQQYCPTVKVSATATSVSSALDLLNKERPDIVFMDIDLQGESSFKILKKLPTQHGMEIIIISSHKKYALKAFKHLVTDYVLKPLAPKNLKLAVEKAKHNIILKELVRTSALPVQFKKPLIQLAIPSVEKVEIINISDVLYLESEGRYTIFHMKDNTKQMASKNLGEYEKLLVHNNFLRIHHSILANMDFAQNIHKKDGFYLNIGDKKHLPISKRKINHLYKYLNLK